MGCSEVISCFIWKKFFVIWVDQCCEVDQNGLKQFKKLGKSLLSRCACVMDGNPKSRNGGMVEWQKMTPNPKTWNGCRVA